ncbi:M28 family peptidase [Pilimelia terevasa]|nr:M28 family peptidase [Pilimelia terevasa]
MPLFRRARPACAALGRPTRIALRAALVGVLVSSTTPPAPAAATPPAAGDAAPASHSAAGARPMTHLRVLQRIADAHGGNRAHGSPGYRASVAYVSTVLRRAGWTVNVQRFTYDGAAGWNVVADWPYGDPTQVVMLGAHLDSVPAGPGINDNGSGTAAVLEVALAVARARLRPAARLRLGWWGAEEAEDLVGSAYYARRLGPRRRAAIRAYLNFDMVGARRTVRWDVYHRHPVIGRLWAGYFAARHLPTRRIANPHDTDSWSFGAYGIPVGGITSGPDPCYHRRCDRLTNVDPRVLRVATGAAVRAAWRLATDRGALRRLPMAYVKGDVRPAPSTLRPAPPRAAPGASPPA